MLLLALLALLRPLAVCVVGRMNTYGKEGPAKKSPDRFLLTPESNPRSSLQTTPSSEEARVTIDALPSTSQAVAYVAVPPTPSPESFLGYGTAEEPGCITAGIGKATGAASSGDCPADLEP